MKNVTEPCEHTVCSAVDTVQQSEVWTKGSITYKSIDWFLVPQ